MLSSRKRLSSFGTTNVITSDAARQVLRRSRKNTPILQATTTEVQQQTNRSPTRFQITDDLAKLIIRELMWERFNFNYNLIADHEIKIK